MLIPLGILATAGAGGAGGGPAYEHIATATGTGSSTTISFSSIPQDYKHLQLRWVSKNNSGNGTTLNLTFNGVTTTSYARHTLTGNGSTVTSAAGTSDTSVVLEGGSTQSTTSGAVAAGIMDILDYTSTSKNKTVRALIGRQDVDANIRLTSGLFISTNAISSLTISYGSNNFSTLSKFALYGIKG